MYIPQNLPTALAFWSADGSGATQWQKAAKKQTFRQSYCNINPEEIAVQVRYDRFLPWIVERSAITLPIAILLVEKDAPNYDTVAPLGYADISALMTATAFTYNSREFIEHAGSVDINQATAITANSIATPAGFATTWAGWVVPGGLYYLVLVFADSTRLYSELIQIVDFPEFSEVPDDDCESRVRIECINNCELGGIPPVFTAPQKIFFRYPASKPAYLLEKTASKSGQRQEKALFFAVKKRWKISLLAPETVADFCSLLPLYASLPTGVNITDTHGTQSSVTDVEVEITWPDDTQDCLALIEISFTREFATYTGCC